MKSFRNIITFFILISGDLFSFILGLCLAIVVRYRLLFNKIIFIQGIKYFLPVFLIWLLIFYIFRLYELIYLANKKEFFERLFKISLLNIISAIIYFYTVSVKYYRPSLVLILTVVFSLVMVICWRIISNKFLKLKKIKVIFKTFHPRAEELKEVISLNPQLGYELSEKVSINTKNIIIQEVLNKPVFYNKTTTYYALEEFYELIFQKVPLDLINEYWFHIILSKNTYYYELLKRLSDVLFGFILLLVSAPFWPIIAMAIKLESEGPILYRSRRIGYNKQSFYIYKFRTMIKDADKKGPAWTLENDPRITKVGKILRKIHLDELPQVINILKGDLSFVGPRPEEEPLAALYEKEIPFYSYRYLMKPGVVGWAQINFPHSASIEEAKQKYEYDLYYLKNRNLFFDFIIAIKAWRIPFEIKTH